MIRVFVLLGIVGLGAILVVIGIALMEVEHRIRDLKEQLRDLDLEERG